MTTLKQHQYNYSWQVDTKPRRTANHMLCGNHAVRMLRSATKKRNVSMGAAVAVVETTCFFCDKRADYCTEITLDEISIYSAPVFIPLRRLTAAQ